MRRIAFLAASTAVLLGVLPGEAAAFPAFSRKEGVPCSGCHVRFNRLNQAGLDYYRKMMHMVVEKVTAKTKVTDATDQNLSHYFSLLGTADLTMRTDKDYKGSVKATLYGGGALSPSLGFLVETTLNPAADQEIADLWVGYVKGNDKNYIFARGGQILPMLLVDNPWEVAADRHAAFPRDRRFGGSFGVNAGKFWAEVNGFTPARIDEAPTQNKFDAVVNSQYTFTSDGSSIGAFAWSGNVNHDKVTSDPYDRTGVVVNFNEVKKLYLSAGYTQGKGDFGSGGTARTTGTFGQVEYLPTERLSLMAHYVQADPNTSKSGDGEGIWTLAAYFWPQDNTNFVLNLVSRDIAGAAKRDNQVRVRLRFMM